MTVSFDTSRSPLKPMAISGCASMIAACLRSTELEISAFEPRRVTWMLSGWPVATSVARKPVSSICTAAKTNTTSAMPPAVSTVVSLRVQRLRTV